MRLYVYHIERTNLYTIHVDDGSIDRVLPLEHAVKYIAQYRIPVADQCRELYNAMIYRLMAHNLEHAYH